MLDHFAAFVEREAVWFRGYNRETRSSLEQAEQTLGQTLPASLKWLLSHYGYWRATGIGGLPFVVGTTRSFRPTFPADWIVLSRPTLKRLVPEAECGPAERGVVILITAHDQPADGRAVMVCDVRGRIWRRYSGFAPYVIDLQQQLARAADPVYRDCLPSFHQQNSGMLDANADAFNLEEFRQRLIEAMLCQQLSQTGTADIAEVTHVPDATDVAEAAPTTSPAIKPAEASETPKEIVSSSPTEAVSLPSIPPVLEPEKLVAEVTRELQQHAAPVEPTPSSTVPTPQPAKTVGGQPVRSQYAKPSPAYSPDEASVEVLEQELRQILVERRETLRRGDVDIPRDCYHNSSSTNRVLELPDNLPGGRLLATSLAMTGNPLELLESVLEPTQHIAILQQHSGRTDSSWLISWVADGQVSLLTNHWFRLTGAHPDWIMQSGEPLADLPGRLQRSQEAA